MFVNGVIHTGSTQPIADSLLVRDERIAAVGSERDAKKMAAPGYRTIDLHRAPMIPGLIDTHTHALDWARTVVRGDLDLRYPNVRSIEEIRRLVAERARQLKAGAWILGNAWDNGKLRENRYLTRADLDEASGGHPVFLMHVTGHLAFANSAALRLAGIDAKTSDPAGGLIERDARGQPTGIVKDNAMDLVMSHLAKPDMDESIRAIEYLSKACAEVGLTSIHDVALLPDAIAAYYEAHRRHLLRVRVQMSPLVTSFDDADRLNGLGVATSFGDSWLKFGAAKIFADGGMAARTIAIYPPAVEGEPNNFGLLLWKPEDLQRVQMSLASHGWQLATHAIGDRAIDEVLDSYADVERQFPNRDLRERVIHAGLATPAIQERLQKLHVLVDDNPPFVYFLGKHFRRYGAVRGLHAYPAKSYLDRGIVISGGSDVYVTPLSPWWGLWALVERKEQDSNETLAPEERVTFEQALRVYTYNGAYAGFEEAEKGTLEAGKLADFVILDRDPFQIPGEQIKDVKVLETWLGGKQVYARNK